MKDNEIVELYWLRDESAIAETTKKYGGYFGSISFRILQNRSDAEECVNEAYLFAWNTIPPSRPENLATFVGKIVRNLSINRYKKDSAKKRGGSQVDVALTELEECISSGSDVEKELDSRTISSAINAFLYSQSEQKRNIFIRRYWHLYSVNDISMFYGMSESKVTSILFRMRKSLKNHLEKEGIYL